MEKYGIMYILSANLDDAARKAEIEKLHGILAASKANVTDVKEWGLRDFAYPIKKQTKGYYVVIKVAANSEGLKEVDGLARLDSEVIRFLSAIGKE